MTSESMLTCFSRFSQYLNRFNSDFDSWIVVGMRIWLSSKWHWSQPILRTRSRLRFLGPIRSQLRVKIAKNIKRARVWYKTMKNIVLWGFWPCLTFGQPRVDQGHFGHFGWKGTLSASVSERVTPCHYICSHDPMERKWYFWIFQCLVHKSRSNKIWYQQRHWLGQKTEGWPEQEVQEQVLPLPPGPWARYFQVLRPQIANQGLHQVREVVAVSQGWGELVARPWAWLAGRGKAKSPTQGDKGNHRRKYYGRII